MSYKISSLAKRPLGLVVSAILMASLSTQSVAKVTDLSRLLKEYNIPIKNPTTSASMMQDHFDPIIGSNSFVWNNGKIAPYVINGNTEKSNQKERMVSYYFENIAAKLGASKTSVASSVLTEVHDIGRGGIVARYQQQFDGIPVFGRSINLLVNQKNKLIAASGYFSSVKSQPSLNYSISMSEALLKGFSVNVDGNLLLKSEKLVQDVDLSIAKDGSAKPSFRELSSAIFFQEYRLTKNSRIKKVYFPKGQDKLVSAYYLEVETVKKNSRSSKWMSYVIDGNTGKVLFKNNLTAHVATTYKVFANTNNNKAPFDGPQGEGLTPHPTGDLADTPAIGSTFVLENSVTIDNAGLATDDPWLTEAQTSTSGNNVDAYADISGEDGFDETDVRPEMSSANAFNYDFASFSEGLVGDAQKSAVVNLFYTNNYLHDWFYDNGFDEAAGNAQVSNFGRGGREGDVLLVEAQDVSGTNNANMSTPADGSSPRMQMFIWTFLSDSSVEVDGITDIETKAASFGPTDFDVNAIMALADDGVGNLNDACETISTDLTGLIAVIDRGDCNFTVKVKNAQDVGAIGVMMVNNVTGGVIIQGGEDDTVTIPSMMVSLEKGAEIKAALEANSNLSARLYNQSKPIDGTLDNGIVAHEWAHYLTNRLVGNANGLTNNQGRSMGEGWSDFVALLLAVKESDNLIAGNENFQGVYSASTFVGDAYYGIRRAPYSTDMNKNALTFKHIEAGVSLPLSHPTAFGVSGANNAAVHATGEIWANALWESYVGLINKPSYSFSQAQEVMKDYLVASLKMTPNAPTILEARDALLAVALANDSADFDIIRNAFSKRGMGAAAVAPERSSVDHSGVVEDFTSGVDLQLGIQLNRASLFTGSCDNDGVLDSNENAEYTLTVKNYSAASIPPFTVSLSSDNTLSFFSNQITFIGIGAFGEETSEPFNLTLDDAVQQEAIVVNAVIDEIGAVDDFIEPSEVSFSLISEFDYLANLSSDDMSNILTSENDWSLDKSNNISGFEINSEAWYGVDSGSSGSSDLITPVIKVAATGDTVISFDHFYFFESSEDTAGNMQNWDAGVIEVSINGNDFVDVEEIGAILSEPYNGIVSGSNSILGGRNAYTFTRDPNNSSLQSVTLTFPEGSVNGQDIRVRFRIGTDANTGDFGWLIDNINVSNAIEPMFSEIVAEDGICISANAPVADAGDDISIISRDNSDLEVNLSGSASDIDGDDLAISWQQRSGTEIVLLNAETLTPSFSLSAPNQDEALTFELTVNDGTQSHTDLVEVNILLNQAPTVTANGGSVIEGNQFTLNAVASDNESDPVTYLWTQTAGPTVTLSDSTISNPIFTAPEVSTTTNVTFSVVVNDGNLDSEAASANVIVSNRQETSSSGGGGGSFNLVWLLLLGLLKRRKI